MVIFLINDYEIRIKNNEQILYLYLNFDTEFSLSDLKKNIKSFKSKVKEFVDRNNIDFKGTTVAIVVGGLMIGTLTLENLRNRDININDNYIVSVIRDTRENKIDKDILNNDRDEKTEILNVEENNSIDNSNKNNVSSKVNTGVNKGEQSVTTNQPSVNNNETSSNNSQTQAKQEENVKTGTMVNVYRSNGTVLNIELEEYLIGVVGAEMPASFNVEALKAQAVLARTYAMKSLKSNKKLTDNNSTQNYKSNDELKVLWGGSYSTYYQKIKNAVDSTKGKVLTYNGTLIESVYHSTSNGYTEDAINVWGNSFPYLVSVESNYDSTNRSFKTTTFISYSTLSSKLNQAITVNSIFDTSSKTGSGRVKNVVIDGVNYNGVDFRMKLGLRSTDFVIEKNNDGVNITTKGYGHGVGMSQYGANGMANNGYSYDNILLHYYKGVKLSTI